MEVFIHDQSEKFTNLDISEASPVVVSSGTTTDRFVRPEIVQSWSPNKIPCSAEDGYSYTRVSEDEICQVQGAVALRLLKDVDLHAVHGELLLELRSVETRNILLESLSPGQ